MAGAAVLAQVPFFRGLPAAAQEALAQALQRRRFRRGEVVFRQGDPGQALYIVESGEVKLCLTSADGKEAILALVGPGGFFGELAVLDGQPRSADAVARVPSVLLALHREAYLTFLREHPDAAASIIAALSRRLRRTTALLQDAAFLDVPGRLARLLLALAESSAARDPDGVPRPSRLTQGELGDMVGASRETVNKWLGVFERQGAIRRERGRVVVVKPDALRARLA